MYAPTSTGADSAALLGEGEEGSGAVLRGRGPRAMMVAAAVLVASLACALLRYPQGGWRELLHAPPPEERLILQAASMRCSEMASKASVCANFFQMAHHETLSISRVECRRQCLELPWCTNWLSDANGVLCSLAGPGRCKPLAHPGYEFHTVNRTCVRESACGAAGGCGMPRTTLTRTTTSTTRTTTTVTTTSTTTTTTRTTTTRTSTSTSTTRTTTSTSTTTTRTTTRDPALPTLPPTPPPPPPPPTPAPTAAPQTTAAESPTRGGAYCGLRAIDKLVSVWYGGSDLTPDVRVSGRGQPLRDIHYAYYAPTEDAYLTATVEGSDEGPTSYLAFWADCDGVPYHHMNWAWEAYCPAGPVDDVHRRGGGIGWAAAGAYYVPPKGPFDMFQGGEFLVHGPGRQCAFRSVPVRVGSTDASKCVNRGCSLDDLWDTPRCADPWLPVAFFHNDWTPTFPHPFKCLSPQWPRATSAEPPRRKGSFIVLGDWGWDPIGHYNIYSQACQREIGDRMHAKMLELGDVRFVVNVGDSFYPDGVHGKDDYQWQSKWRDVYSEELRSVPWYSVYGNHDYHKDSCACSDNCAQVNADPNDRNFFYMPSPNFYVEHPEMNVEVIGLDLNKYMTGEGPTCCGFTQCKAACEANLNRRSDEGMSLFWTRFHNSPMKNMVVFSHYPTDYFQRVPSFLDGLRDRSRHHIAYFGGHRHNTDNVSTTSTHPNDNWVVGGGGGFGCEPGIQQQGFVVGEVDMNDELTLYPILVDNLFCCKGHTGVWTT